MSNPPFVCYFAYYGFEKTVIDSQVITPLTRLATSGENIQLVFMENPWRWVGARLRVPGIKISFLPRVPRNMFFLNTVLLALFFLQRMFSREQWIIHARGFQGAAVALPLKKLFPNLAVICDARGIESEEYLYSQAGGKRNEWVEVLEKTAEVAVNRSDFRFYVSNALREHFEKNDLTQTHVVPCATQVAAFSQFIPHREEVRKDLGLGGKTVLVYSGGLQKWQGFELLTLTLKAFFTISPDAYFMALTPDVDKFRLRLEHDGVPLNRCLIRSAKFNEIQRLLPAGDIGLLLRENLTLNHVSFPTKFAEYLAAGLHVAATPAVLDIAAAIREHGVGTLLEDINDQSRLEKDCARALSAANNPGRAEKSINIATTLYDWSNFIPVYRKIYNSLAPRRP